MDKVKDILYYFCFSNKDLIIIRDYSGNIIFSNKNAKNLNIENIGGEEFLIDDKYYELTSNIIQYDGINYIVEVFKDITEYKKLVSEVYKDELTKLYNFKTTASELKKSLDDFNTNNNTFAIAIGDVDNFKNINDTIGHINANDILESIGKVINENTRSTDIAIRFGGEEFMIILRDCTIDEAYNKIETIRKKVNSIDCHDTKVSMSFGIDLYDGSISIEDVQKNADLGLYESKKNGKNKTTIYKSIDKKLKK